MMPRHFIIQDKFYSDAAKLRECFDRRFAEPKETRSDRFVWDFWHVPDQYTLLRTPAEHFFPQTLYRNFLRSLTNWSQENLGCSALTPPWLSYYIEGCEQKLHSDVPHGPWAFVYSLSPPKPKFSGGETLILRPEVLDYWRNFTGNRDREQESFVERIPSPFNRLVVFDPRLPHGVTPLRGTMDPREARLVLHGWFTEPKPYLKGALTARQVAPLLDEAVGRFSEQLANLGLWHGVISLRLFVGPSGQSSAKILADTLVSVTGDLEVRKKITALIRKNFFGLRFPRASGKTEITLPLLFR